MFRTALRGTGGLTGSTSWLQPRSQIPYTLRRVSCLTPNNPQTTPLHSARLLRVLRQNSRQGCSHLNHRMSTSARPERYKLIFFAPTADVERCKEAIFTTGAGTFPGGKYTKCCFQTVGTGQFLPSEGANPAIGAVGDLERCEEARVEIMCLGREVMLSAVEVLVQAHPYEEVPYEVYKMEDV